MIVSAVHSVVKQYTPDYDRPLIFHKVHHELNQVRCGVLMIVASELMVAAPCFFVGPSAWWYIFIVQLGDDPNALTVL